MANLITGCRILCSIIMIFFPAFSVTFYVLYLAGGVTDMVDGLVARKTNTVSKMGSRLDSIADVFFVAVSLFKILPAVDISTWLWIWIAVIAAIKVINILSGFLSQKRFVAEHTIMNKVTGFLLFLLPLTLTVIELNYSGAVVCCIATFAAIQEGHYIRTGKEVE
ncbi:CDP-alcohol phosphatidyltransferase family protein [Aminicella lysinilytica]|uniref:CDP-diacylglycerol--glycerol-3-phosphate 3-phosphatidyltransferase n=1 Tax=Aminicella lysinilytica TaxID=433323 RepID=A0A4R6Q1A4_9FIRM|nr:CDP-alcohol phosphatidyltransferase family protein [Aminicella lysinilytica]TDP54635.1 CDP-diacylglycerol--glycerol-3-phosphate 3-phosphatidyltransferase [Aminicella lysinilytica]